MHDLPQIDGRLSDALRHYADSAVLPRDATAIARTAHAAAVASHPIRRRQRMLAIAVGVGLILALALAALATVGQRPSLPAAFAPGSIAFTRDGGLYVAAPDGGDIVRLASAPSSCCFEAGRVRIASDGRHVAYLDSLAPDAIESAERLDILDTHGGVVGSYLTAGDAQFAWAPDGNRLVVVSDTMYTAQDRATHLIADHAVIGVDGRAIGSISLPTGFIQTSYQGQTAIAWSPDGRSIALSGCLWPCDSKFDTRFLLVPSDGTGSHWLTEAGTLDTALSWAPGSGRIAVGVFRDHVDGVDILAGDGSLERHVALPPMELTRIAWSPDGTRFAVEGATDGEGSLVLVGVDGATHTVPTTGLGFQGGVGWSADGQRIVLVGGRSLANEPTQDIWSIAPDGSDQKVLVPSVDQEVIDVAGQP